MIQSPSELAGYSTKLHFTVEDTTMGMGQCMFDSIRETLDSDFVQTQCPCPNTTAATAATAAFIIGDHRGELGTVLVLRYNGQHINIHFSSDDLSLMTLLRMSA